jgi:hypothetical protein
MTKTKLTLCSLAAMLVAGQAFAHTGVRDEATEGTTSYNGFTITHGCGEHSGDMPYPVLGQAGLFPFGADAVWKDNEGNVIVQEGPLTNPDTGGPINNGNGIIASDALSLSVTGYAGFASPFATTQEIVNDKGSVQALFWKDGAMEPKLNAITPFKISAPTIVDDCTRLKIRVGVINYCDIGKNEANDAAGPYKAPKDAFGRKIPKLNIVDFGIQQNVPGSPYFTDMHKDNGDNNRADWWFAEPEGGSLLYNDLELLSEWSAEITVNNSPAQLATCPKDEDGNPIVKDVTVEPNGHAFDTYLTGPNTRPFTKGNSNF